MSRTKATSKLKLNKDTVSKLPASEQIHWFDEPQNLGIYVGASKRTWKVRLMVVQADGSKRRKVGSLGSVELVSIEEVQRRKLEAELAATKGIDLTDDRTKKEMGEAPTLSFMLDWYIRVAEIKDNTRYRYLEAKKHADEILPELLAAKATRAHFLVLKDRMRHIKPTFNKLRAVISAAYNYFGDRALQHAGQVMIPEGFNPVRRVKSFTNKECKTRPSDPYTEAEAKALIEAARAYLDPFMTSDHLNPRHIPGVSTVALILGLFFSGCRKMELAGISKTHVEAAHAPKGWTGWWDREAGLIRLVNTKTGARDVPVTPQLHTLLMFLLPLHDFWMFPSGRSRSGHVTRIEAAWNRLHRDAGVRRRNPHQTRHTVVTRMIEEGEGPGPAGGAVGHSTKWTTETYIRVFENSAARALRKGVDSIHTLDGWDFLQQRTA